MFDKKTYKLLTALYEKGQMTIDEINAITGEDERKQQSQYITSLLTAGYISEVDQIVAVNGINDYETIGYKIEIPGKAYIEQLRRDGRNFWVPYAITTFIAFLSLVVSLMQLFGPVCTCPLCS